MICYCPFCSQSLPEKLIDGLILCPKCNRLIESTPEHKLLAAYRILKRNRTTNLKQFKFELQLSEKEFNYVVDCYDNEFLSVEEFQKKLKASDIKSEAFN